MSIKEPIFLACLAAIFSAGAMAYSGQSGGDINPRRALHEAYQRNQLTKNEVKQAYQREYILRNYGTAEYIRRAYNPKLTQGASALRYVSVGESGLYQVYPPAKSSSRFLAPQQPLIVQPAVVYSIAKGVDDENLCYDFQSVSTLEGQIMKPASLGCYTPYGSSEIRRSMVVVK